VRPVARRHRWGHFGLSPYCDEFGSAVLNTIDRFAYAFTSPRDDNSIVFRCQGFRARGGERMWLDIDFIRTRLSSYVDGISLTDLTDATPIYINSDDCGGPGNLQRPGLIGSPGWVRSSAWIWLFSSIDNTTAWAGGSTHGSGRWPAGRIRR